MSSGPHVVRPDAVTRAPPTRHGMRRGGYGDRACGSHDAHDAVTILPVPPGPQRCGVSSLVDPARTVPATVRPDADQRHDARIARAPRYAGRSGKANARPVRPFVMFGNTSRPGCT
ncbi:protein of unknown function [Burkholderia multivorans]